MPWIRGSHARRADRDSESGRELWLGQRQSVEPSSFLERRIPGGPAQAARPEGPGVALPDAGRKRSGALFTRWRCEEGYESASLRGQRPKLLTYFQLCLKPHLDVRSRDCRELAVTRSLDLSWPMFWPGV